MKTTSDFVIYKNNRTGPYKGLLCAGFHLRSNYGSPCLESKRSRYSAVLYISRLHIAKYENI